MAKAKVAVQIDLNEQILAVTAKTAETLGVTKPKGKNPLLLERAVLDALREKYPNDELEACPTCKKESPISLTACPFCGQAFEEDTEHKHVDERLGGPKDEEQHEDAKVTSLAAIKAAKSAKAGSKAIKEKPAPVAVVGGKAKIDNRKLSKDQKKAIEKEATTKLAQVIANDFVADVATVQTPVEAVQAHIVEASEKTLYDALNRIRELQVESFGSWWEIGQQLSVIYQNDLWKIMRSIEGEPLYRNWKQFVETETSLSDAMARIYMSAARFSKDQALSLGAAKIALIDTVAESARPQLLTAAKELSSRELVKAVRLARVEFGSFSGGKRSLKMNSEEEKAKKLEEKAKRKKELEQVDADSGIRTVILPAFDSGDIEATESNPDVFEFDILGNNGAIVHVVVDVKSKSWSSTVEKAD